MIVPTKIAPRLAVSAVVGALIVSILTIALFATEFLPQSRVRANLQQSFANGSLQDNDWPWEDRARGYNQYNDCLLTMMPMFREGRLSSAIAPVVVFNDYPKDLKISECAIARAAVFSANPRTLFNQDSYFPYYRYVHAYRIPFNILIAITTVDVIRTIYRLLVLGILAVTIALHARRLIRSRFAHEPRAAIFSICSLCIAVGMGTFSGLDLFAQSLTHGPSDILVFGTFAILTLGRTVRGLRSDATIAALAALAFGFDFLHGTIPMTLAIVIGCAGLRAFEARTEVTLESIVKSVLPFFAGLAGAAATKLVILIAARGWDDIVGYYYQLRYRMDDGDHGIVDVVSALGGALAHIAWGYAAFAKPFVILSLVITLCTPVAVLLLRVPVRDRVAVLTAWTSIVSIFCWYIVFRGHSAVHAPFMVRLLSWPISMAPACVIMLLSSTEVGYKLNRLLGFVSPSRRPLSTDAS